MALAGHGRVARVRAKSAMPRLGMSDEGPLTRRRALALAWPIMLSSVTTPLIGVVDIAVIGRTGSAHDLGAVALGALIFSFAFWSFGFLRMGTTGLTARARGAGDRLESQSVLFRTMLLGALLGAVLLAAIVPIRELGLFLLSGDRAVEAGARAYASARAFGAPAALAVYACTGWLVGMGRTREVFALQLALNAANAVFDVACVVGLHMGPAGVGAGTALAEWTALAVACVLCWRVIRATGGLSPGATSRARLLDGGSMRRLLGVNRDLMVRTVALLVIFAWFTDSGARLGATTLAANHVLLQFVTVTAFVLDAFAMTAESEVGAALGEGSWLRLRRAVRVTSELAVVAALLLSAGMALGGGVLLDALTDVQSVRAEARRFLPFAAVVPVLGVASWQLDGIFIGATRSAELRNAALLSTTAYVACDLALRPLGALGVWLALLTSYVWRAASLARYYPRIEREARRE